MAFENNLNYPVQTAGCGTGSNIPGVAVYSPEVSCPGAGYGASTFASPATALKIGLTNPIATFRFTSSTGVRRVLFGSDFSAACTTLIEDEVGGTVVNACDDGVATKNKAADSLCCYLDQRGQAIVGLILKSPDSPSEINATQVYFDPCNPCFTSDTNFVCSNGCNDNSNFILTNAVIGANAGLVVEIPANTAATIDVCSCAPEVRSFATCPNSMPSIASIAPSPACATVGYPVANGRQF